MFLNLSFWTIVWAVLGWSPLSCAGLRSPDAHSANSRSFHSMEWYLEEWECALKQCNSLEAQLEIQFLDPTSRAFKRRAFQGSVCILKSQRNGKEKYIKEIIIKNDGAFSGRAYLLYIDTEKLYYVNYKSKFIYSEELNDKDTWAKAMIFPEFRDDLYYVLFKMSKKAILERFHFSPIEENDSEASFYVYPNVTSPELDFESAVLVFDRKTGFPSKFLIRRSNGWAEKVEIKNLNTRARFYRNDFVPPTSDSEIKWRRFSNHPFFIKKEVPGDPDPSDDD